MAATANTPPTVEHTTTMIVSKFMGTGEGEVEEGEVGEVG